MAMSFACLLVIALILGFLTLRRSGIYFSILTLAFAEMAHALILSSTLQKWTGGDNGLTGLPSPTLFGTRLGAEDVFYLASAILIVGFFVARIIRRSPFGLMLRSVKENPMRLEYTGVNVFAYKMAAFVISAMYAGLAGSLIVIYEPYVATKYIYWSTSGEVVIMSVIGGIGTLIGPIIGAAFMLYFENVVQGFIGGQWKLVLGLIFVFIVIFLPGGIAEMARRIARLANHSIRPRRRNVPDMALQADEDRRQLPRRQGGGRVMPGNGTGKPILEVRGVSKNFGGLKALSDVNLTVEEGTIHAIIGPNGAGKSTLLNVLIGLIEADTGTITYGGEKLSGLSPHTIIQKGIARVFQTPQIFPALSLLENVAIGALAKRDGQFGFRVLESLRPGHPILEEAAEHLRDVGLADHLNEEAQHLSRGDKRRLELALCLAAKPRLLLLDEPTAGMSRHDTNRTIDLLKQLSSKGMTKIVIEHDMHVVFSLSERISVLAQGSVIAEGRPEEVRGNPRVQEAYLGGAHHE